MKKVLLTSLLLMSPLFLEARTNKVVVAVIDTGLDRKLMDKSFLCPTGHKDFSDTGLNDTNGHGTHISGLIDQYAKSMLAHKLSDFKAIDSAKSNYCQIIIKCYDPTGVKDNLKSTIESFRWAIDQKVDIINYSGGGKSFSKEEKAIVVEALNKGIIVVAAAGNNHTNLSKAGYYPASYDKRVVVVGNLIDSKSRMISDTSNYGSPVNTWETGTDILSRLPNNDFGALSGTSQATAIKSGKLIKELMSKP